jgi:RNA polymerase sigma-70 factor (ECF subfamily)
LLLRADPSPVVALNRAAAVAMRDEPAAGVALIDAIRTRGPSAWRGRSPSAASWNDG